MTKKEKLKKLQKRLEWLSSVFGKIEDHYNEKIRILRKKIREEEMEAKKKEEVTTLVTSDKIKKSPVKAQSKAKTNKKTPANKKKTTNAGKKSSNRK